MADSSSEDSWDNSPSGLLQSDPADYTQRRLAYFHSQNPSPTQTDRYEIFHKFSFLPSQPDLKGRLDRFGKLIAGMVGGKGGGEQVKLALATAAKIYVAKLVERSVGIASGEGHRGPLLPGHVEEAKRRMSRQKNAILA